MTGSWLTVIAQSLLVYELTSSGVALGVIGACQFLPVIFFSSWAGLVADRYDKRRALLLLQSAGLAQSVALALVATMDRPPIAVLCVFAAMRGATAAFDLPIRRSMVVETVPPGLASNAIGLNSAVMASSLVCGSAIGGALVALVGFSMAFLTNSATYVVALVTLWRIKSADLRAPEPMPRRRGQLGDSVSFIRSSTELRIALSLTALTGFAYNFPVVLPILVSDGFGRSTTSFTYIYSALSVGSVCGALTIARRTVVDLRLLARLAAAFGVATIALGLNSTFLVAFPIATSMGLTGYALLAGSISVIQTNSEPSMRGRIVSFHSIASIGTWAVTAPLVGWLCETAGPRVGITSTGVTCLLAATWARAQIRGAVPPTGRFRPRSIPTSRFRRSRRDGRAPGEGAAACSAMPRSRADGRDCPCR